MTRIVIPPERPLVLPTREESEAIAKDVLRRVTASQAGVSVNHHLSASAQFTRGEVRTVRGNEETSISLMVDFNGRSGSGWTNRLDDEGLQEFITDLELVTKQKRVAYDPAELCPGVTFTDPPIYFPATADAGDPEWQGDLMRQLATKVGEAKQVGAGDVSTRVSATLAINTAGMNTYTKATGADLSLTARTASGKGSGWAWDGGNDMTTVNPTKVVDYAMDIARRSDNPQAVEPGRYTVILEPEAVANLVQVVLWQLWGPAADSGGTVFSKKGGGNKLGLQVWDRRSRLTTDPFDPLVPYSTLSGCSEAKKMEWISNGILRNLCCGEEYGQLPGQNSSPPGNGRLELEGAPQTLDDMIRSTQRGIWIHRFSGTGTFNYRTLLLTGVTRDGTFLIENGKITKPVKNLRFMESPMFVMNKIESWGIPERTQGRFVAPRLKANDFEFIALSEAI